MNRKKFIQEIKKICKENGVTLILKNTQTVKYLNNKKQKVGGYFCVDNNKATLLSATKGKWQLATLLHELSHMDQWIENEKTWRITDKKDSDLIFDRWLKGKNYHKKTINETIKLIQANELDCEKRTVKKLKEYKIGIDSKTYIKSANAYIYLYTFLKDKRKWPDRSPSTIKPILDLMPSRFLKNYNYMSNDLKRLYNELCYHK